MFSRKLNYKSLPNIRDLGGMRTDDGRQIKSGKLIRSGHLSRMPEDEVSALAGLVGAVIDFRSDGERIENPDALLADAEYYHFPVVQSLTPGVSREEESDRRAISQLLFTPEEAKNYMVEMYRSLASDYAVAQYAEFVRLLLQGNKKAVLWHCTAGKDRAGTAAVIIEEILGIPREVIIADFADESLRYLFGADEDFIKAYYEAAADKYGSMDGLIREGLGLSDRDREELKEMYLL